MTLRIWGRLSSINVRKVVLAAQLLELSFERIDAGASFGITRTPETIADIPSPCEMHRWWGLPMEHPRHPHLERWYQGIRALPAARGVLDLPLS